MELLDWKEKAKREEDELRAQLKLSGITETWNTEELQRDFRVVGFCAPFVVVTRKKDGRGGSMQFSHRPRLYWGFVEG